MRPFSFMGFPSLQLAYGKTGELMATPARDFQPLQLLVPGYCVGFDIERIVFGVLDLVRRSVPAELFSEVSTFHSMVAWRPVHRGEVVTLHIRAPSRPRPVHWGQWRDRKTSGRHGLGVKPARARAVPKARARHGLWVQKLGRPWWVPPPLPPVFSAAFRGEVVR